LISFFKLLNKIIEKQLVLIHYRTLGLSNQNLLIAEIGEKNLIGGKKYFVPTIKI
jgi:hypothetical protein